MDYWQSKILMTMRAFQCRVNHQRWIHDRNFTALGNKGEGQSYAPCPADILIMYSAES